MCLRRKRDRESQRDIIRMLDLPWLHLLVMYNKLSLSMNKVGLLNVDCIALDKFAVQLQTSRNTKQGALKAGWTGLVQQGLPNARMEWKTCCRDVETGEIEYGWCR